jgi:predicted kinase
MSGPPTLHLVCGLPGSGKSTLAAQLEIEHRALRLTPDVWMSRIVGEGYDEARRAAVEAVQWDIAARALELGVNVVLENGFWRKAERLAYRDRAAALGARTVLHPLIVPKDELIRRLARRNANPPRHTFAVSSEDLSAWYEAFEPPEPGELA